MYLVTLEYSGVDLHDDDQLEALAVAASWIHWVRIDGETRALITADGESPTRVALDAINLIRKVVPDAIPVRVVHDLVAIPDIARRIGVNRETVRTWFKGTRGPGGFPRPRGAVGDHMQIWDWGAVNEWLRANLALGDDRKILTTEENVVVQLAIDDYLRADKPWCSTTIYVDWDRQSTETATVEVATRSQSPIPQRSGEFVPSRRSALG
jgi:hypothetical protein